MQPATIIEISKDNFDHMDFTHKLAAMIEEKAGRLRVVDYKKAQANG